ncbi:MULTISPECIES: FadR/GntR family transcriptional regulator [Pseudomonadota]|jgi:DNA-binding FadR family transcriptional regulator|uniref:Transcriptional regulator, GntR family n=1 Tax=Chelativorans sp. (strain BNC1) TaxID=266779 RepID=Q11H65_CHESB|nr:MULTISPECIES: FadR/GntR family transcriptional regulator [Chelativorans]
MPELTRRPSLFSHTLNQLGRQIVSGRFGESGVIPPEPKLCEQLGASRGVVREVLRVLSQKGLISAQPKIGIRVEPEHHWNVMDIDVLNWLWEFGPRTNYVREFLEFRLIFEPAAASAAAKNATEADRREILELYRILAEESDRISDRSSDERAQDADLQFHLAVFRASRNRLLVYTGTLIGHIMRQQIAMTTSTPGVFRDAVPLHKQMAEAIATGNHREAERAARDNVIWTQNALEKLREHQAGA